MRKVTVNKLELLGRLRRNLEGHVQDYSEACAGYRKKALEKLAEAAARLEKGETVSLGFALSLPESHEQDYRQIIAMMEMEVADTVELSSDEFACYCLDDWGWKRQFAATASLYK